jgi:Protein of unknown function with PCYCGC motif
MSSMGKKSGKKKADEPEAPAPPAPGGGAARWVAIGLLVLGTGFFVYASMHPGASTDPGRTSTARGGTSADTPAPRQDPGQRQRFRYFENPEEAHPLPVTLPPSEFKNPGIANTYRIAKDIPEVLAQQPCLCGCDSSYEDHRSLLDCYRDQHASTCTICMKEAILADKMTKEGRSAKEIRDAIIRHDFTEVSIGN